jgi:hypothetical protein
MVSSTALAACQRGRAERHGRCARTRPRSVQAHPASGLYDRTGCSPPPLAPQPVVKSRDVVVKWTCASPVQQIAVQMVGLETCQRGIRTPPRLPCVRHVWAELYISAGQTVVFARAVSAITASAGSRWLQNPARLLVACYADHTKVQLHRCRSRYPPASSSAVSTASRVLRRSDPEVTGRVRLRAEFNGGAQEGRA